MFFQIWDHKFNFELPGSFPARTNIACRPLKVYKMCKDE